MRLRVAKNVALARSCGGGCGHRWPSIQLSVRVVCRAMRRGTRRIPPAALDYWRPEERWAAGLAGPSPWSGSPDTLVLE